MIQAPVQYKENIKAKIDEFNSLKADEKIGAYWEKTGDAALSDVKKHIKDYYINVQDHICPYCRQQIVVDHNGAWDAEHIIPKDVHPNFMFEPENLCVSCKDCNGEKSNKNVLKNPRYKHKKLPRSPDAYIICHPHFDNYEKEIRVVNNPLFFIPKSEKGRKTIEICGLLRFMYKVSAYGDVPKDIADEIGELQSALADAPDAGEQTLILTVIREKCDEGIKIAQRARVANLIKQQSAQAA